jgi:MFS family permease
MPPTSSPRLDDDAPQGPRHSVWRDVWALAVAQVLSGLGAAVVSTLLILQAQAARGTSAGLTVAAIVIAAAVPTVLLAPLVGRLADRFSSRLLLFIAGGVQIGACLLISALPGMVGKIGGLLLLFAGTALGQPVRTALLPAVVTEEDLPKASAITQTASVIGPMAGPPVAGFAYAIGVEATIRWAAVAFVSTVLLGLVLRTSRGEGANRDGTSWRAEPRIPLDGLLRVTFIGLSFLIAAVSIVNVVEVFLVRGTLEASPQLFGVVTAMWPAGMVLGAWAQARLAERARDDATLVIWLFTTLAPTAAMIALVSVVGSAIWIVPLWLIGGVLNGADNVLLTTLMGRRAAPEARGRVAAVMQATIQGSLLVGYVVGGFAVGRLDPRVVVFASGVAGLIAVVAVLPWVRATVAQVRREPLVTPE